MKIRLAFTRALVGFTVQYLGIPIIRFTIYWGLYSRFPNNPIIIRVPFFLLFNFNKETPNKKGKRVLLGHLDYGVKP